MNANRIGLVLFCSWLGVAQEKRADPAAGKLVFEQCRHCHDAPADSLKGLYKRSKLKNGAPVSDQAVLDVILGGSRSMPPFVELSEEDLRDLIAYLRTL